MDAVAIAAACALGAYLTVGIDIAVGIGAAAAVAGRAGRTAVVENIGPDGIDDRCRIARSRLVDDIDTSNETGGWVQDIADDLVGHAARNIGAVDGRRVDQDRIVMDGRTD